MGMRPTRREVQKQAVSVTDSASRVPAGMNRGRGPPPPLHTSSPNTAKVQQDWENREFMQTIQVGIAQMTNFLNDFDGITRGKLSQLDDKLTKLERRMNIVEATLTSVDHGQSG